MGVGSWTEMPLGEFAPFVYGKGLSEKKRDSRGEIPVFGSNGQIGRHTEALVSGPGVIIGRKGTVGSVSYSAKPFWPIDTTFFVPEAEHRDIRFTYYLLRSLGLEKMNSDSAVPGLNRDAAHSVQISVPPLAEQRRIAHILGTLDDKIELNRRMNATLEAMARALFKSWFVDFDPVHAKTAGHPSGLPLEIEALFPDSFADSELGPIPEGWEVKVFGDFLETKTEKMKGGQSEPYSATNEGLFLRNEKFNKQLSRSLANYKRVDYGDLVFGLSRGILNFGVMKDSIGCVSPVYQVFKINETVYLPLLLEMLMRGQHHYFKDLIKPGSREGQGVDREYLSSKRITVPNMECQKAFDEIRKLLGALIDSNSQEIVTLSGLRDRLLLKLLSGRVSNAYF